jgi:hypothetical protein
MRYRMRIEVAFNERLSGNPQAVEEWGISATGVKMGKKKLQPGS